MGVGPLICQMHLLQISVFLFVSLIHTCAVHSGYWICDDNGMHDEHHRFFNCNYGTHGIMDSLYGSYRLPEEAARQKQRDAQVQYLHLSSQKDISVDRLPE